MCETTESSNLQQAVVNYNDSGDKRVASSPHNFENAKYPNTTVNCNFNFNTSIQEQPPTFIFSSNVCSVIIQLILECMYDHMKKS